jgi:thiol-disulfide isomerase/thioredoxin
MKTLRKIGCGVVTGLALAAAGCAGPAGHGGGGTSSASSGGDKHAMVGVHAPSFSRPAVVGTSALSTDHAKGKVLVVDFWATYCKPCEKSFPKLQAIADKHPGNMLVYGLSEDESPEDIAAFVKKTGVRFPIGWDQGNAISQRKLEKMPTSYVVDKKGVIRFVHGGYTEGKDEEIARQVEELLR